jgi:hypothetical protein
MASESRDSLARTLIIVICVLLGMGALAFILVVALEPHRRTVRDNCPPADPVVVGQAAQ